MRSKNLKRTSGKKLRARKGKEKEQDGSTGGGGEVRSKKEQWRKKKGNR